MLSGMRDLSNIAEHGLLIGVGLFPLFLLVWHAPKRLRNGTVPVNELDDTEFNAGQTKRLALRDASRSGRGAIRVRSILDAWL